jgi:hypothetical protein
MSSPRTAKRSAADFVGLVIGTSTSLKGMICENQNFVLRRFGEAVRPESYRGLAERARLHRATT